MSVRDEWSGFPRNVGAEFRWIIEEVRFEKAVFPAQGCGDAEREINCAYDGFCRISSQSLLAMSATMRPSS